MPERFKFNAYDITLCGYYPRRSERVPNPMPCFGGVLEVLRDIQLWVDGKTLSQAKGFSPSPEDEENAPIYCFDIQASPNQDLWVLTTWNELPTIEAGVQTANGAALVGDVNVNAVPVGEDEIPGFPSYFVFLPNDSVLFTLRPSTRRLNGHKGLVNLFGSYMRTASSYVVWDEPDELQDGDEIKIQGYRAVAGNKPRKLVPKFASHPRQLDGEIDFLRRRIPEIRKIVRKDHLSARIPAQQTLLRGLLGRVGLVQPIAAQRTLNFKYELDFNPTPEEFEKVVSASERELLEAGDNEVGFMLRGEADIRWLHHSTAKDEWELPLAPRAGQVEVFDATDLVDALQHRVQDLRALAEL